MPCISIPVPPAPAAEVYHLGTAKSPAGTTITTDAVSLRIDGERWMPVMGEFHYTRFPASGWREELLKMKAGGIDCVSTYIFWIHHEEIEGVHDWSGDRDLHRFVALAGEVGLRVVVRIGPWCHGEVRNGGLPDWVVSHFGSEARTDTPAYLDIARRHFAAIAGQLGGLLWKQGGPIVAFQIENEYSGPAEHLLSLKRLAIEAGLDAPLYTRTGWPDLATPMPFGELLPLYGAYPEGFWDRALTPMPGFYPAGFRFSPLRTDAGIATDLLGERAAADTPDTVRYPFLTCELGGGMMSSYHRRIRIDPRDIESVVLTKLGDGGNLPGYYMYHGGVNPEGRTSLQESQATKYWNDLPEKNYDFQAPLGAAGQLRPHYHRLRRLHLFVRDYGALLAGMPAAFPAERPASRDDTTTLRWAVRSTGRSGFVFVNNYERLCPLLAKPDVRFTLDLPGGRLEFPSSPITVPADSAFIWPFGLDLAPGVRLDHATAQLICKIDEGKIRTVFFTATPGVPAEFAFNGRTAVTLPSGRGIAHTVAAEDGAQVRVVLLDPADSLALWKDSWQGRERVFLTRAGLVVDKGNLRLASETDADLSLEVFPALDVTAPLDGVFQKVALASVSSGAPREIEITPTQPAGSAREIPLGWTTPPVAMAPIDADFAAAATWRLELPAGFDPVTTPLLRLHYAGDVARVRVGSEFIQDDFYNGDSLDIDLTRHADALAAGAPLTIEILPLRSDAPIHLPEGTRPKTGSAPVARLDSAQLIPRQTAELNTPRASAVAARPLFRDPAYDGAADPVVIWNRHANAWWMFYTNRRANDPALPEIAWVHGTQLGIAESRDGGAHWSYVGKAAIKIPTEYGASTEAAHWAPEIIEHAGVYHMFLTVVPGIFTDWQHPRSIVHLTSPDLETWIYHSTLKLTSDRVIDACVLHLPDGRWRLWYNDERAGKAINLAESPDLYHWTDLGLVPLPDRRPGEGPKVFRFGGAYWMIVDEWCGQGVYRSADALTWSRQSGENLLSRAGTGPDDAGIGAHADVVVNGDRAWIFYFTHPERPVGREAPTGAQTRRSSLHVAELTLTSDGRLVCERDTPVSIQLPSMR